MKKKNEGISLITLVITIIVMLIIASTVVTISMDRYKMNKFNKMVADLELLQDKVSNYYLQYGELPVLKNAGNIIKYTSTDHLPKDSGDNENYYILDLEEIGDISLYYGKEGFEKGINANETDDVYIINEQSHTIYYVRGIEFNGEDTYHRIRENELYEGGEHTHVLGDPYEISPATCTVSQKVERKCTYEGCSYAVQGTGNGPLGHKLEEYYTEVCVLSYINGGSENRTTNDIWYQNNMTDYYEWQALVMQDEYILPDLMIEDAKVIPSVKMSDTIIPLCFTNFIGHKNCEREDCEYYRTDYSKYKHSYTNMLKSTTNGVKIYGCSMCSEAENWGGASNWSDSEEWMYAVTNGFDCQKCAMLKSDCGSCGTVNTNYKYILNTFTGRYKEKWYSNDLIEKDYYGMVRRFGPVPCGNHSCLPTIVKTNSYAHYYLEMCSNESCQTVVKGFWNFHYPDSNGINTSDYEIVVDSSTGGSYYYSYGSFRCAGCGIDVRWKEDSNIKNKVSIENLKELNTLKSSFITEYGVLNGEQNQMNASSKMFTLYWKLLGYTSSVFSATPPSYSWDDFYSSSSTGGNTISFRVLDILKVF